MSDARKASRPAVSARSGPDGGAAVLEVRGLRKSFGGVNAVDGVDFSVGERSIHALIGPNGAGKTTCFNLVTKFLQPTSGTIVYRGRDITGEAPASVARRGLVRSFQISAVFPKLTVHDNVLVALQRRRGGGFEFWRSVRALRPLRAVADELLERVGLQDWGGARAGELPYGRKRSLEIATTLALEPDLLLLDEPMAGMTQDDVEKVSQLILEIARTRTVLMVEHNLRVVKTISDHITVLSRGKVLASGDYASVSNDPAVIEAYLGTSNG